MALFQQSDYAISYGVETEFFGPDFAERYPFQFGGIVVRLYDAFVLQRAAEECIGSVYEMVGEEISVGDGKGECVAVDFCSQFFVDFTDETLRDALPGVDKASGKVEGAFGRIAVTSYAEQFLV